MLDNVASIIHLSRLHCFSDGNHLFIRHSESNSIFKYPICMSYVDYIEDSVCEITPLYKNRNTEKIEKIYERMVW